MNVLARFRHVVVLVVTLGLLVSVGASLVNVHAADTHVSTDDKLAPYVPTPQRVVDLMLRMAEITKDDVVYDLGSGDGRIVITAAKKYGARGVGFEIDEYLLEEARENAREAGVSHLVEFRNQDLMTADLSPATIVTLYLLPEANLMLRPRLLSQLRIGARVVSHNYDMGDWEPLRIEDIREPASAYGYHTVYLWRIDEDSPEQ